jgi:hypothetical protein
MFPSQAARRIDRSVNLVRYLVDNGTLAATIGPGGVRLISRASVQAYLKRRTRKAEAARKAVAADTSELAPSSSRVE